MQFKECDSVTWTSQAGGSRKVKIGVVVQIVRAGERPDRVRFPSLYSSSGVGHGRKAVSYVVLVGKTAYWPRESLLQPVGDPLEVVYCPGCAERLETANNGCPHCGYEDPEHGRVLSITEIMRLPSYPTPGAARYQDVSPAFIAAVVAAARAQLEKI